MPAPVLTRPAHIRSVDTASSRIIPGVPVPSGPLLGSGSDELLPPSFGPPRGTGQKRMSHGLPRVARPADRVGGRQLRHVSVERWESNQVQGGGREAPMEPARSSGVTSARFTRGCTEGTLQEPHHARSGCVDRIPRDWGRVAYRLADGRRSAPKQTTIDASRIDPETARRPVASASSCQQGRHHNRLRAVRATEASVPEARLAVHLASTKTYSQNAPIRRQFFTEPH